MIGIEPIILIIISSLVPLLLFFSSSHIVLGFWILCYLTCTHELVLSAVSIDIFLSDQFR